MVRYISISYKKCNLSVIQSVRLSQRLSLSLSAQEIIESRQEMPLPFLKTTLAGQIVCIDLSTVTVFLILPRWLGILVVIYSAYVDPYRL